MDYYTTMVDVIKMAAEHDKMAAVEKAVQLQRFHSEKKDDSRNLVEMTSKNPTRFLCD